MRKVSDLPISSSLGGVLLVAGTTIGAGMLALPTVASSIGLYNSSIAMILIWISMCYTATLIMRLNLHYGQISSLVAMAETHFGKLGKMIAIMSVLGLFYSLVAAYICGINDIIAGFSIYLKEHNALLTLLTVTFLALLFKSDPLTDYGNRFLFTVKMIFFIVIVIALLPSSSITSISNDYRSSTQDWFKALPIFFTSFGFHGSISAIMSYLLPNHLPGKEKANLPEQQHRFKRICSLVLILGSLIPLALYLLWILISLSNLELINTNTNVEGFDGTITSLLDANYIKGFSFCAIATSLIGVVLGLTNFFIEAISRNKNSHDGIFGKYIAFTLAMVPPAICAIYYADLFLLGLSLAAIFLSILAIILPCGAVIQIYSYPLGSRQTDKLFKLHKHDYILLPFSLLIAVTIIVMEISNLCAN